jgi:hypothetical protein
LKRDEKKKETVSRRRNGVSARTETLGNEKNPVGETQLVSIPDPFS